MGLYSGKIGKDSPRSSLTIITDRTASSQNVDPDSRPIRQPPDDVDEPYLAEDDGPGDSFVPAQPAAPTLPQRQRASAVDQPQSSAPAGVYGSTITTTDSLPPASW